MIEYDNQGRIKYNPELHDRQGTFWDEEEIEYLIKWYDIIGMEEMSLALGRTEATVANKVYRLQIRGKMPRPDIKRHTRKILKDEINKPILAF